MTEPATPSPEADRPAHVLHAVMEAEASLYQWTVDCPYEVEGANQTGRICRDPETDDPECSARGWLLEYGTEVVNAPDIADPVFPLLADPVWDSGDDFYFQVRTPEPPAAPSSSGEAQRVESVTQRCPTCLAALSAEEADAAFDRMMESGRTDTNLLNLATAGLHLIQMLEGRADMSAVAAFVHEMTDGEWPNDFTPAASREAQDPPEWRCSKCGSTEWVAASLTGPVSHGGRAIRQCVPCGHYSDDPAPA